MTFDSLGFLFDDKLWTMWQGEEPKQSKAISLS